jgi:hypothetical protein
MQENWHVLALYALLALSLFLSLFLWVSAHIEWRREARRAAAEHRAFETEFDALHAEAAEFRQALVMLDEALRELQDASGALVPPPPTRSGLNVSARSQVLRRHRGGEDPAGIAASLGLPRAEVDLLLKVNRIVTGSLRG